jgi:hypothetical protein
LVKRKHRKLLKESVSKCPILFKVKKGEKFNRMNTLSISRIKIFAWRRAWAKGWVLKLAQKIKTFKRRYQKCILGT